MEEELKVVKEFLMDGVVNVNLLFVMNYFVRDFIVEEFEVVIYLDEFVDFLEKLMKVIECVFD